jgi:hypothetical protein
MERRESGAGLEKPYESDRSLKTIMRALLKYALSVFTRYDIIKKRVSFSAAPFSLILCRPDRPQHPLGLQPPPEKRLFTSETLNGPISFNFFSPQLGQASTSRTSSVSITVAY